MSSDDFKIGDMVTLKEHCRDSGRLAILTGLAKNYNACKIQWIDETGLKERQLEALKTNLVKVE